MGSQKKVLTFSDTSLDELASERGDFIGLRFRDRALPFIIAQGYGMVPFEHESRDNPAIPITFKPTEETEERRLLLTADYSVAVFPGKVLGGAMTLPQIYSVTCKGTSEQAVVSDRASHEVSAGGRVFRVPAEVTGAYASFEEVMRAISSNGERYNLYPRELFERMLNVSP